jgi:hypothetical protein
MVCSGVLNKIELNCNVNGFSVYSFSPFTITTNTRGFFMIYGKTVMPFRTKNESKWFVFTIQHEEERKFTNHFESDSIVN